MNNFESIYDNIPYQPIGTSINSEKTLPYGASSIISSFWNSTLNFTIDEMINFFDLQAIYGSTITKLIIDSAKIVGKKPPFVISDSIGIGMSQYGVAYNY